MNANDTWLVFDFDGTLADSFLMAHRVFNSLAERHHYRPLPEDGIETMRRQSAKEFIAAHGIPMIKVPLVAMQARHELRQHIADIPPFRGIADVLPILQKQGYRMGILTSNATDNVYDFLESHDLDGFFDFIYCSRDIFGKARRIKALIRKHQLDPASLIYVGDMHGDIEAAHRAGIRVAAVSWGYQAREALASHNPTWLLDTPAELAELHTLPPSSREHPASAHCSAQTAG